MEQELLKAALKRVSLLLKASKYIEDIERYVDTDDREILVKVLVQQEPELDCSTRDIEHLRGMFEGLTANDKPPELIRTMNGLKFMYECHLKPNKK